MNCNVFHTIGSGIEPRICARQKYYENEGS